MVIVITMLLLLTISCTVQPLTISSSISSSSLSLPVSSSSSPSSSTSVNDFIRQQLGYFPSNFVRVSAWKNNKNNNSLLRKNNVQSNSTTITNSNNNPIPVAIQTYPLNGGAKRRQAKSKLEGRQSGSSVSSSSSSLPSQSVVQSPFPTLFWLTCPDISKAVADLERRGYVQIFEDEINSKPDLVNRLLCCHEEYAQLRWQSLTEEDRNILTSSSSSSTSSSSSSSLTSSLLRMRNIMELSGISGTNFTDWRLRKNQNNIINDNIDNNNGIEVISFQNNNDNGDENNDNDNDHQLQKFQREEESSSLNYLAQVKVPPIKCLHAHYAHYRSTCTIDITDDDESDYLEISTTTTAAAVVSYTANPVGEMIHKQLKKDFSGLDL